MRHIILASRLTDTISTILELGKRLDSGGDRPTSFFTMSDVKKLGINPLSGTYEYFNEMRNLGLVDSIPKNATNYNTPVGIYCYPFNKVWAENIARNDLPFASNRKYIHIFTLKSKFASLRFNEAMLGMPHVIYTSRPMPEREFDVYTNALKKMFPNVTDADLAQWTASARNKNRVALLWWFIMQAAGIKYSDLSKAAKSSKPVASIGVRIWTSIMRRLGIVAYIDDAGARIIHPHEPEQAVMLDPVVAIERKSWRRLRTPFDKHGLVNKEKELFDILSDQDLAKYTAKALALREVSGSSAFMQFDKKTGVYITHGKNRKWFIPVPNKNGYYNSPRSFYSKLLLKAVEDAEISSNLCITGDNGYSRGVLVGSPEEGWSFLSFIKSDVRLKLYKLASIKNEITNFARFNTALNNLMDSDNILRPVDSSDTDIPTGLAHGIISTKNSYGETCQLSFSYGKLDGISTLKTENGRSYYEVECKNGIAISAKETWIERSVRYYFPSESYTVWPREDGSIARREEDDFYNKEYTLFYRNGKIAAHHYGGKIGIFDRKGNRICPRDIDWDACRDFTKYLHILDDFMEHGDFVDAFDTIVELRDTEIEIKLRIDATIYYEKMGYPDDEISYG